MKKWYPNRTMINHATLPTPSLWAIAPPWFPRAPTSQSTCIRRSMRQRTRERPIDPTAQDPPLPHAIGHEDLAQPRFHLRDVRGVWWTTWPWRESQVLQLRGGEMGQANGTADRSRQQRTNYSHNWLSNWLTNPPTNQLVNESRINGLQFDYIARQFDYLELINSLNAVSLRDGGWYTTSFGLSVNETPVMANNL